MKKKRIEQIPYIGAGKAAKEYEFVAVQQEAEIGGELHLIVEVYENEKGKRRVPKLRMVFTERDWGNYRPDPGEWSGERPVNEYGRKIWRNINKHTDANTYMAADDVERVRKFCERKVHEIWMKGAGWEKWLLRLAEAVSRDRNERRMERRAQRLKERIENTPPLPEDLEQWADKRLFGGKHFLYYKRKGRYADIGCSKCGRVMTRAIRRADAVRGITGQEIEKPIHGTRGRCPECGAYGEWKAQGTVKGIYALTKHAFIGQQYKEDGAVIRYVECAKEWWLEEQWENDRKVMSGVGEKYIITELARTYFQRGSRPQNDYHKYSGVYGESFWDDCNTYYGGISVRDGLIYDKTFEWLKGTILQYSGAKELAGTCPEYNLMDYMERYLEYPQMEMFSKMGLTAISLSMAKGFCGIIENIHAKRPEDFLGIRRERMGLLIRKQGEIRYLNAMKKERRMGARWTEKELELIAMTNAGQQDLELALGHMSMHQLLNRLEKYSGVKIMDAGTCERACSRLNNIATLYFDYLNMRRERGYNLDNKVFLWPRDLLRAHERMVNEINQEKIEKREKEVEEDYPDIRKNYRKLRNRYFYEDGDYMIRPARSAAEIVAEGRMLHHCVGGNNYLKKHNNRESVILFLRERSMPEMPYITVEIKEEQVVQWYGAYDRKTDEKNVGAWLKKYVEHLKEEKARKEENVRARVAAVVA